MVADRNFRWIRLNRNVCQMCGVSLHPLARWPVAPEIEPATHTHTHTPTQDMVVLIVCIGRWTESIFWRPRRATPYKYKKFYFCPYRGADISLARHRARSTTDRNSNWRNMIRRWRATMICRFCVRKGVCKWNCDRKMRALSGQMHNEIGAIWSVYLLDSVNKLGVLFLPIFIESSTIAIFRWKTFIFIYLSKNCLYLSPCVCVCVHGARIHSRKVWTRVPVHVCARIYGSSIKIEFLFESHYIASPCAEFTLMNSVLATAHTDPRSNARAHAYQRASAFSPALSTTFHASHLAHAVNIEQSMLIFDWCSRIVNVIECVAFTLNSRSLYIKGYLTVLRWIYCL